MPVVACSLVKRRVLWNELVAKLTIKRRSICSSVKNKYIQCNSFIIHFFLLFVLGGLCGLSQLPLLVIVSLLV